MMSSTTTSSASPVATSPGFWAGPWRFPQAITLAVTWIGIAAIVQARFPHVRLLLPAMPWNWLIVCLPLGGVMLLGLLRPRSLPAASLGGTPMAIVSVAALALASLPAGIWPQGAQSPRWQHDFGLSELFSSLPFAAAAALVMLSLSAAVGRRLRTPRRGAVTFLLIHLGALLALAGAAAGTATFIRAQLVAFRGGQFSNLAEADGKHVYLPFAVQLDQFVKETFPPRLSLVELSGGGEHRVTPGTKFMEHGAIETIGPYTVEVAEYLPAAAVMGGVPRAFQHDGVGPAVRVQVRHRDRGDIGGGWLHSAGPFGEELYLHLSDEHVLMLQTPQPRTYESHVRIVTPDNPEPIDATVAVNRPLAVAGWNIYQHSYDSRLGSASNYSVFQVVRDPALPVVYVGIYMLIAGVCLQFWQAARKLAVSRRAGAA